MKIATGLICMSLLVFTACQKEVEHPVPDFDVSLSTTTYSVGEEVVFQFAGDADLISFYSGEVLNDYAFREGRIVESGSLTMSFQSNFEFGAQDDQLSIWASNDFNGNYTSFTDGVELAAWNNITDRFVLGEEATYVNSGEVDVSDLSEDGIPFYIGFRYRVRNQNVYGTARTWRVQNFSLTSETSIGLVELGNNETAGFQLVDKEPEAAPHRSSIFATIFALRAAARTPENGAIETEHWAVTKAFSTEAQNLGPDRPVPIKGVIDDRLNQFVHIYSKPGKYKAYFVASNTSIYNVKEVVRSVDIEIVE